MKFNVLFISCSVIYAKFNYCYDVPKEMPSRYFDGTEWKTIKTRHRVTQKAPEPLNIISKELDWGDLIQEMKEIVLVEPAPEVTESTFAVKETTTTSKILITKMAATPKFTIMKRPTQSTTIKTNVNHSPNNCKLKFTTTTIKCPAIAQMKEIQNVKDWITIWTSVRPTVKPTTVTTKSYFAKTTKQCPKIRPTKELVTTTMPAKLSGTQGDGGNVPENWSNLLKEFLKFVESKKCEPPCKPEAPTSDNLYLLGNNRKTMSHDNDDDLMNILMDGVEIDDRLSEDDYLTSQKELVPSKGALEDQSQILDFEPDEDSAIDYEQQEFSGDNVLDGDVKSNEVAIRATKKQVKTAPYRKKMAYLDEFKAKKSKMDYVGSPIRRFAYLDELSDKCTKKSDEIVKSSEIKSYFKALQDKHVKKEKELSEDKGIKASLDEENYSHSREEQVIDIRKHINYKDYSKDTLNSKDMNEITDDVAPKHTDSTEIKSKKNDEDVYQDKDITFESLESDGVGADKYSTQKSSVQGGELEYYGEAVNGINEQKDDITIKSEKNINSVEFKKTLNEI